MNDAASGQTAYVGDIEIDVDGLRLPGTLVVPADAIGVVLFAHGSGSSRRSPRNRQVAAALESRRLGTVLFDLLAGDEEQSRDLVFDVPLLGTRLLAAIEYVRRRAQTTELPLGLFGASTGAGAALWAAAEPGSEVAAVVSRGGRPDLAGERLHAVRAPTLLIVGGEDPLVLELNREAERELRDGEVVVVPGAGHLFEERGALDAVSEHAATWFGRHMS